MTEQPGEMNTPDGDGPVDLDDRVAGGAPAANQRAHEHVHPGSVPSMSVGEGDPQAPSHPAAGDRWLHGGGDVSDSPEEQDTDVVQGAAQMADLDGLAGVGEPQGVPVASVDAASGTSEDHGVVQGARTPSTGGPSVHS